jgi:hypothetical protein
MKKILQSFIGELIDELQDGFVNGVQDVVQFIRENVRVLLESSGGSEMAVFINMGVDSIMKLISQSYMKYKEAKKKERMEATKKKENQKKEEEKKESQKVQRDRIMERYRTIMEKDFEK